jgi:hypothetical protein
VNKNEVQIGASAIKQHSSTSLVSLCSDAHMKLEKPAHVAKRIIHKDNFCIQ